MRMSIFDEAVENYHTQQVELSHVNGTTDQYVQDIYHLDPLDLDDTINTPPWDEIERMNRRAEELRHYPEHQREIRDFFGHIAMGYSEYWKRDKTPPEKRDKLFYARRYASLFETCDRKAECWLGMPSEEWTRFNNAAERYAELVSILEGKTPQEHYRKRWDLKEDHWRYWANANAERKEAIAS